MGGYWLNKTILVNNESKINFQGWDQVRLKLTQSPAKAGVEFETQLGNSGPLTSLPVHRLNNK